MDIAKPLLVLVRIALLFVLVVVVVAPVVAIGRAESGPLEKLVLSAAAIGLLMLALPVRRIGRLRA
jgi:hypothetical protein